ncbi:tyrosine-type recombinase/integrase [Deinococcus sp.]|uniref:tyrosine-type recombinase/integrase n=1 Tax=Deinococcus sp. TaxID=47478 RepID=UPI003C7DC484
MPDVFGEVFTQLQQGPVPDERELLRRAVGRYDTESCWTILSPRLPGVSGSHSQKNYFSAFKDFLAWAKREGYLLADPPPQFGPEFQQYLQEKYGASLASINTRLSQARRFYKLFRQLGVVAVNIDPFSILTRSTVVPGEHREYYTETEVARLLAQADLSDRAMLLFGAHVGLTTAELLALSWPDISLTEGTATLLDRRLVLSDELYRVLQPLAERQGGGVFFSVTAPIFEFADQNALRAQIYGLCLRANVPYRAWRGLRHAAGLRFYRQTGDLQQVARQLGVENHHLVRMYREVSVREEGPDVREGRPED